MKKFVLFSVLLSVLVTISFVSIKSCRDRGYAEYLYELKLFGKKAEFVEAYMEASDGARRMYSRICTEEKENAKYNADLEKEAILVFEK